MKKNILVILLLAVTFRLTAQNQDIAYPHLTPMTPNAASFAIQADFPVSYYTGVPDISIPLHEIDLDGFKLPISLSYHASGIRVDQEASWAGLGWALNAGSSISRTVKGIDDFLEAGWDRYYPYCVKGYYDAPEVTSNIDNYYDTIGVDYCIPGVLNNLEIKMKYDSEPDIFYYNLPTLSGKFLLDKSRGAILFNKSHNIKVDVIKESYLVTFKITDAEGNQYFYNDKEKTKTYAANSKLYNNTITTNTKYDDLTSNFTEWSYIRYGCDGEMEPGPVSPYNLTSSWCVSKIITKNGHEIKFTYETEDQYLPTQESQENYQHNNGNSYNYFYKSKVVNSAKRLSKIEGDFGYIKFNCSAREDIKGNSKKVDSISIYNSNNSFIKSFRFDYSYFNDDYSGDNQYVNVFKRLKLNRMTECSSGQTPLNSGYDFNYYEGAFPAKNSKDVDLWGFQNGKRYGSNYCIGLFLPNYIKYNGVKKEANFNYAIIGTLKEISYPTGGKTEFVYESNTLPGGYFQAHLCDESSYKIENLPVYNNYIMNQYDYPSDTIYRFEIAGKTELTIKCTVQNEYSDFRDPDYNYYNFSLNPLGRLRKINPSSFNYHTYECPLVYDGEDGEGAEINLTEHMFTLDAGVYEFQAYTPPKDVVAFWQLNFNYLTPNIQSGTSIDPYKGGGIRINQIISESKIRRFKYPTGKMLIEPVLYYIGTRFGIPNNDECIVQVSESKMPLNTFNNGNFVGYDWVEEYITIGQDTSKIKYSYYNDMEGEAFDDKFPYSPTYINYTNGLIKNIESYSNSTLVKRDEYTYISTFSNPIKAFIDKSQRRSSDNLLFYNYTIEWPLKEKEKETLKTQNGNEIISETSYTYNSRDLLQSSTFNYNGYSKQNILKYPFDFQDDISLSMVNKNMIGIPVETISLKDNLVLSGKKTQYMDTLNLVLAKTVSTVKTKVPLSLSEYQNHYTPELFFERYNDYGKIIQLKTKNSVVTYLWGYNNQYLIAEIKNATYNQVSNVIPGFINYITGTPNPSEEMLNSMSNSLRSGLPEAEVTTFTYKPLVGVTSITNPRGITTYYNYDLFNRLQDIKDKDVKTIQSFIYNYQH